MTTTIRESNVIPLFDFYKKQGGVNALYFAEAVNSGFIRVIDAQGNLVGVTLEV